MAKRKDDLKEEGKLTPKMERFARIYSTSDGNGTASAITAGYAVQGAHVTASRLLRLPKVAKAIAKYRARTAERLDVSREKLVNDAAHDAEQAASIGDYNAANNARTLIAKVQGYIINRSISATVDLTTQHIEALRRIVNGNGQQSQVTEDSDQEKSQSPAPAGITDHGPDLDLTAEAVPGDEDK